MNFWRSETWRGYERESCDDYPRALVLLGAEFKTRVLDLRIGLVSLWRGVRDSYRAPIKRLREADDFRITEASWREVVVEARALHAAASGRATRSTMSWGIQGLWVDDGIARCFLARRAGVCVGFVYVITWHGWAYYFSAVATEPNVGHALQWEAIERLAASGMLFYELGWQGKADDEKGKNIEFAKRGWGGIDVPPGLSGCAECLASAFEENYDWPADRKTRCQHGD